jgi:hypothetical protein
MAPPQFASGTPHGTTMQRQGPPTVRLVAANGPAVERRRLPSGGPKRISGWIVQVVVLATTAFALLDLYLLLPIAHT